MIWPSATSCSRNWKYLRKCVTSEDIPTNKLINCVGRTSGKLFPARFPDKARVVEMHTRKLENFYGEHSLLTGWSSVTSLRKLTNLRASRTTKMRPRSRTFHNDQEQRAKKETNLSVRKVGTQREKDLIRLPRYFITWLWCLEWFHGSAACKATLPTSESCLAQRGRLPPAIRV